MSLLAKQFREAVAKNKDPRMSIEAQGDVAYPTGFHSFDFLNGAIVKVKTPEIDTMYYSVGISDGSFNMVIGRSGCGKTSWITQVAAEIVRPFKTSCIFEDSVEGGLQWTRRLSLSRFTQAEAKERYIVRDRGVTAENFYKRIKLIRDTKVANPDSYQYNTGLLDSFGQSIIKYEPTVYILDSIAVIMPEEYSEDDELAGNMAGAKSAKIVTQIFRTILPMLKEANIILFVVNHTLPKIEANPMAHTQAQLQYLKPNERLPKGDTIIYLANCIIRLDDAKKIKEDKDAIGINGSLVELSLLKSRTGGSGWGKNVRLVFDQNHGFDRELSMFVFLKERGRINGAGVGLYIDNHNDIKFSQKGFREKLHSDPLLCQYFTEACSSELKTMPTLPFDIEDEYQSETNNLMYNILNTALGKHIN